MTIKGMIAKLRRALISQRVSTGTGGGGGGGGGAGKYRMLLALLDNTGSAPTTEGRLRLLLALTDNVSGGGGGTTGQSQGLLLSLTYPS